jgi:predicted transcriptional regulator
VVRSVSAVWTTEAGEVVPQGRVKRIRLAQDVLSSSEESVYDALWNAKTAVESEGGRIIQAGYDSLMKKTRLSKKTIQRIIDHLIAKDFIAIERRADIYQRTPTVYRVFSYRHVLERQTAKGRFHVVKIGPGLLYAHVATVGKSNQSTEYTSNLTTDVAATTVTGAKNDPTTVVGTTTIKIEQNTLEHRASSSEVRALRDRVEKLLGPVDDEALGKLLAECRTRAGDSTVEEIAYFVEHKLRWMRNIHNPVGFVLAAVPKHFANGAHLGVRELLRQEAEARRKEWQETQDYWKRVAEDPTQPEEERAEARHVLARLAEYFQP